MPRRQRSVDAAGLPRAAVDLALRRPPSAGGVRVVALDGRSGAGKTTLAAAVVSEAARRTRTGTGTGATLLAMEDLYPGWDGLEAAVRLLHDDVLAPLAAGAAASHPLWDWAAGVPGTERARVASAPLLVVEGVGAGAWPCLTSVLVWVAAPGAERHRRAMGRDGATYAPHWERWAAQERDHLLRERTRWRADLLVRTGAPVERGSERGAGPR